LKLAYLLAQYLYTNKRLDLPGIGTFLLDPSVIIEPENSKHRSPTPDGISFESNPALRDATELISYITSKSGKMKALASADLDSHLQLAQQFLNMGKPFTFEGIGILAKLVTGEFEFTPTAIISEKSRDTSEKEVHGFSKKETVDAKYRAYLATPVTRSHWRKPMIVLLILCGIGLAIWGGYTISTKQSENNEATVSENIDQNIPVPDSLQVNKQDTNTIQITNTPSDNYKYVLEVAKERRAFKRYNQLRENLWKVQLETSDSVQYKLFLLLPASADTTRIVDSLTVLTGRKVYLENRN
jgi:hypothetical protein